MSKIKPIYIFTGFLDAGKTSAIKTSMLDNNFNDGTKSLLICFEDGEIKYDEDFAHKTNTQIINLDLEEFNYTQMQALENNYDFERIIIEFNGMANLDEFINLKFINNWQISEIICFIDSSSFEIYFNNLKQIFYNHIKNAHIVIFNRYSDQNKRFLRNSVKAINPYIQIIYENTANQIIAENLEDIFDLSQKVITIDDLDFGLWCLDILDFPHKYEGKKIKVKAKLISKIENNPNAGFFGRKAMVCCEDDIADISLPAFYHQLTDIENDEYYLIEADIHLLNDQNNQTKAVLYINNLKKEVPPAIELVNFN